MKEYTATIYEDGEPLLEDLKVFLEETQDSVGIKSWYGAFQLSSAQHIEPGGPYRLELDEGRGGDILVRSVSMSSHARTQVSFVGTGPLE